MKYTIDIDRGWAIQMLAGLLLPILFLLSLLSLLLASSIATAAPVTGEGVRRIADIPYGSDPRQRMDIYMPAQPVFPAGQAPVIVMVHGGAWMVGTKAMSNVTDNKVDFWVRQKGFVFVSVGYRLSPQVDPLVQARDVATALATAQGKATTWGGNPARFFLMGHSAGAHLVALVSASPTIAREAGVKPWLGTISLDSAALDLERIMQTRHMRFYDRVFGADPAFWRAASPYAVMTSGTAPMLLVCANTRRDGSCAQSQSFAERARSLGVAALVLEQALSHEEINAALGVAGPYTDAVSKFIQEHVPAR